MELSQVAPELQPPVRRMPHPAVEKAFVRGLVRLALRLMPAPRTPGVRLELRRDVGAGVRIFHPQRRRSNGALLWLHGGGYVIGRAVQDDRFCAAAAAALGIVVVSAEYRLAPEHPYPAALDDGHAVWSWLVAQAQALGIDPARIAVGGGSAGGGLAASLVQRICDAGPGRAVAQWLFCPMVDDRTAARRELDGMENFIWNNRDNAFGWRAYLGAEPGAGAVPPYAAPARRADLSGLPPAWIGVGDIDLFHDEDKAYAERLRAAGVEALFTAVPGAPHGFEAWAADTAIARDFLSGALSWLGERIGDDHQAG